MSTLLYQIANFMFFAFHVTLIVFNLFGWIPKRWRRWNLLTLGLTAFSWFVLGIFFGFGYCFLTDWHWGIREKLGYENRHHSYIHFLVETLFDTHVSAKLVDIATGVLFAVAVILSIMANLYSSTKRKTQKS